MSRDNSSWPLDLVAAALISFLTFALATLPSEPVLEFSALLGIALVFLPPGYALTLALFPRISDLTLKERAMLSLGTSLALTILTALGLSLATGGIATASLAQMLSIVSLALIAAAYLRLSALPKGWRFVLDYRRSLKPAGRKKKTNVPIIQQVQRNTIQPNITIRRNIVMALLAMAIIIAISAFAYNNYTNITITPATSPNQTDERISTEFYVLDESNGGSAPSDIGKGVVTARIINHERRTVDYILRLVLNDAVLSEKKIKLDHNRTWKGPVSYTISSTGERQKLDILLYKDGDFSAPYKEKYIWINASGSDLKQSDATKANRLDASSVEREQPKAKDKVIQPALQSDGGSKGESTGTGNIAKKNTIIENPREPSVEVNASENKEVKQANEPIVNEQQNSSQTDQKENTSENSAKNSAENFSAPGAYWEDSPSRTQKINISEGTINLNVSKGAEVMNASDVDQDSVFNNNASISSNSYSNNRSNNGLNISALNKSKDRKHNINITINKSIINSSGAVQKFYTRPKPGSVPLKKSSTLEIQSTTNDSRISQKPQAQEILIKANNSTNNINHKIDQPKIIQKANTSNKTLINTSNKSTPEKLGANLSQANQINASQDKSKGNGGPMTSEMKSEIDSWVSTRGMNAHNNGSQSFESEDIQFIGKANSESRAVLGNRSTKDHVVLG